MSTEGHTTPLPITINGTTYRVISLRPICSSGNHSIEETWFWEGKEGESRCYAHPPDDVPIPQDGDAYSSEFSRFEVRLQSAVTSSGMDTFQAVLSNSLAYDNKDKTAETILSMMGRPKDASIARSLQWLEENYCLPQPEDQKPVQSLAVNWQQNRLAPLSEEWVFKVSGAAFPYPIPSFGEWERSHNPSSEVYTKGACALPTCPDKGKTFKETATGAVYSDGKAYFHPACLDSARG